MGLLGLMVRRVLPLLLLLLLLLPVALGAAAAPSTAASATPLLCNSYVSAGGLRKRALQHVQGGDHRALFDLIMLMWRGSVIVVGRCHLQSLGLELELELGGL